MITSGPLQHDTNGLDSALGACHRSAAVVIVGMTLLTFALALTLHFVKGHDPDYRDPDGLGRMGREVAAGKGLLEDGKPSAFRGPVVPVVFAAFIRLFGDSYEVLHVVQCLFFALANGIMGLVCWRLFRSWQTTLLSMLIYLVFIPAHPWFLNIFAEPIFTTLLALFMLLWTISLDRSAGWSFAAGLALVAAALCRPVMYYFLPFMLGYELYHRGVSRQAMRSIAAILLGVLMLEIPWVVRNVLVVGKPVLTTTGSSQAWFLMTWYQEANWIGNVYHDPKRFPPADPAGEDFWNPKKVSKEERDARFLEMAKKNLRENPIAVLMLIPKRAEMFLFQMRERGWIPTPKSIILAGGLYIMALLGYWWATPFERRNYTPALLLILFNVAFHALLASEYRYSHPIQPFIFMLSALGLVRSAKRLFGRPETIAADAAA